MLCAQWRNNMYHFYSFWFEPTRAQAYDLPLCLSDECIGLMLRSLTLLSTIFQLYFGSQIYWWRKLSTLRKSQTCRKSLTNFITECCIKYTSAWAGFKLTTLVAIGINCTGSCKSNNRTIMITMILTRVWWMCIKVTTNNTISCLYLIFLVVSLNYVRYIMVGTNISSVNTIKIRCFKIC